MGKSDQAQTQPAPAPVTPQLCRQISPTSRKIPVLSCSRLLPFREQRQGCGSHAGSRGVRTPEGVSSADHA
jgi:hypothetical protein